MTPRNFAFAINQQIEQLPVIAIENETDTEKINNTLHGIITYLPLAVTTLNYGRISVHQDKLQNAPNVLGYSYPEEWNIKTVEAYVSGLQIPRETILKSSKLYKQITREIETGKKQKGFRTRLFETVLPSNVDTVVIDGIEFFNRLNNLSETGEKWRTAELQAFFIGVQEKMKSLNPNSQLF